MRQLRWIIQALVESLYTFKSLRRCFRSLGNSYQHPRAHVGVAEERRGIDGLADGVEDADDAHYSDTEDLEQPDRLCGDDVDEAAEDNGVGAGPASLILPLLQRLRGVCNQAPRVDAPVTISESCRGSPGRGSGVAKYKSEAERAVRENPPSVPEPFSLENLFERSLKLQVSQKLAECGEDQTEIPSFI